MKPKKKLKIQFIKIMATVNTNLDKYDIDLIINEVLYEHTKQIGYNISYGDTEQNKEMKEIFENIINELRNIQKQL